MAGPGISLQDLMERYHLFQYQLDQEVSDDHLKEMSRIIDDRESVGLVLGLTPQEMTEIVLTKWKQKFVWKATYHTLIEALLKCSRADHAQDVCVLLASSKCCFTVVTTLLYDLAGTSVGDYMKLRVQQQCQCTQF